MAFKYNDLFLMKENDLFRKVFSKGYIIYVYDIMKNDTGRGFLPKPDLRNLPIPRSRPN
jgi:hypothetical protein